MKIVIHGQVPAHKNSKRITCRNNKPVMYTKKTVKAWQNEAVQELTLHYRGQPDGKVQIDYMFYVKDKRRRDTDNMVCTVNDALQDAGLLVDDSWKHLKIGSADATLDRDNPRVELEVTEL